MYVHASMCGCIQIRLLDFRGRSVSSGTKSRQWTEESSAESNEGFMRNGSFVIKEAAAKLIDDCLQNRKESA